MVLSCVVEERGVKMSDKERLLEAASERAGDILRFYQKFAEKKPVMLLELPSQKIYAYPYLDFKNTQSDRSQKMLEIRAGSATSPGRWAISLSPSTAWRSGAFEGRNLKTTASSRPNSSACLGRIRRRKQTRRILQTNSRRCWTRCMSMCYGNCRTWTKRNWISPFRILIRLRRRSCSPSCGAPTTRCCTPVKSACCAATLAIRRCGEAEGTKRLLTVVALGRFPWRD